MKFILIFILSLLFIDIIIGCKPKACPPGTYMKCPKRNRTTTRNTNDYRKKIGIFDCQGNWDCKCIKKKGNENLYKFINQTKIKIPIKETRKGESIGAVAREKNAIKLID